MDVKMPTAEMLDISLLKPYKKNPKRHSQTQIDNVAESSRKFVFVQPFVIDKNNEVVIGHYAKRKRSGANQNKCAIRMLRTIGAVGVTPGTRLKNRAISV